MDSLVSIDFTNREKNITPIIKLCEIDSLYKDFEEDVSNTRKTKVVTNLLETQTIVVNDMKKLLNNLSNDINSDKYIYPLIKEKISAFLGNIQPFLIELENVLGQEELRIITNAFHT